MKRPLRIDFTIIFDGADNLWSNDTEFERDQMQFYRDLGMEPKIAKSVQGLKASYTMILEKIEEVPNMPIKPKISPGEQISNIQKEIKNAVKSR